LAVDVVERAMQDTAKLSLGLGLTEDVSTAASRVDVWLACRPGSCW
jgi:hypothetical protein